ncbi:MAG: efflux RND transporter periplasmic adaptor subunit [Desulfovibrio sp.]|jgi:RND family efflux transporter MFP subunit|nr:efflux RND transporter periplasmic adaptor subunit [Mailhella sp.]
MKQSILSAFLALVLTGIPSFHGAMAIDFPLARKTARTDEQKAAERQPVRVVKLHRVGHAMHQSGMAFPGRVDAAQKAKLFFRVSGPVVERDLVLGKPVNQGDVLMRIDPRDYQRAVDNLAMQIQALEAQNALASVQYARKKNLLASKSISRTEFDAAEAEKKASDAQLMALRINYRKAQDSLNDTILRAPFTGNVTALGVELHELAQAGATVVVLEDLRSLKIRIHIPSGRLPDALTAPMQGREQQFRVRVPGRQETYLAVLTEFSPSTSAGGESYEAILTMEQPSSGFILPGMSVEASIYADDQSGNGRGQESGGALAVPWGAVVNDNGASFVWLYDAASKTIRKCPVEAERAGGSDSALVTGKLSPGDLIVAAGGDWLSEGMEVDVLNPEVLREDH